MKFDHINIAAPMDLLNEVRDFYCVALGLVDGPRPDFAFRGYWLYADDKPIVHLMESDSHYPADKPHYLDHIAFQMTELAPYIQRLQTLGVAYKEKHIPDFNISQVFCKDPCGNGVEVNFRGEKI